MVVDIKLATQLAT